MACARCGKDTELAKSGWCVPCERAYDTWVRRHAADIIWSAMGGGVVLTVLGIGLPLLGLPALVGASGAFAGFATIFALHRGMQRRRRRQFLSGDALPRAYLPAPK